MVADDDVYDESPGVRLARYGWRLDALDQWRERTDKRLLRLEEGYEGLMRADEVAHELAKLAEHRQTLRLGLVGTATAALVALTTLGSFCTTVWLAVHR